MYRGFLSTDALILCDLILRYLALKVPVDVSHIDKDNKTDTATKLKFEKIVVFCHFAVVLLW